MDRLLLMAAGAGLFVAGLLTKDKDTTPVLTGSPEGDKPPSGGNTKSVPIIEPAKEPTNENQPIHVDDDNPVGSSDSGVS